MNLPKFPHSVMFVGVTACRKTEFLLQLLETIYTQALHGLAPKCKLINMHELINKSTNDYVTLLPCKNGANVNNKG